MARAAKYEACPHSLGKSPCLVRNLLLFFSREIDKMVVLCPDEERDGGLVEAPTLPVPLFDRVERALPRQVKHEENGHGVVANQGQHVDKLTLAAEVPNRKGDFSVSYGDGLLHEVHPYIKSDALSPDLMSRNRTQCLDVVFVPASFYIFHHQAGLANLCVADHANLDNDAALRPRCFLLAGSLFVLLICTRKSRRRSRGLHLLLLIGHVWRGVSVSFGLW